LGGQAKEKSDEQIHEQRKPSYLKGAAILAVTGVFVKIIGAIYKLPLFQDGVLGDEGTGDFNITYTVFTLILAISTAGIPPALSRLISAANVQGNTALKKRFFSVALFAFLLIGIASMLIMFFFADAFAGLMGNTMAAPGIRVLAPAAFFACLLAVYRGYTQGHEKMVPTAVSQIIEVISKTVFGIALALWLVYMGYELHIVSAGAIVGVTIGLGLCLPAMIWFKRKIDRGSGDDSDATELPGRFAAFAKIMKVSIPITISASFMSFMVVIDNGIVVRRLQSVLELTELEARVQYGIFSRALSIFNLPPSLVVPVSISIIPAIAAALAEKRENEAGIIMQSSLKLVNLLAMPAGAGLMVLAQPILIALYNDSRQLPANMLVILGAACLFVCLQFVTTAILQANGHERVALLTFPIGAALRIIISFILSGNPNFGVMALPISTLVCFAVITVLNILFMKARIKDGPKFSVVFIKPLLCTAVMAAAAFFAYRLLFWIGSYAIGTGRWAVAAYLAAAVLVGVAVYGVLIIVTRTVTIDDMKLMPKGEKIANLLRIK